MSNLMYSCVLMLLMASLSVTLAMGQIQSAPADGSDNAPTELEKEHPPPATDVAPDTRFQQVLFCTLDRPSEVQRYNVQCTNARRVDVQIADCCIPGDHWEAKSKAWDAAPNTAVTTSPGAQNVFGLRSRVYNYGGTPQNLRNINVEVDCSYIHGVNVFGAGSFLRITSDSPNCVVTDLGKRDSINRTP